MLFILAINDILRCFETDPDIHYSIYADDLVIYTRGKKIADVETKLQNCVAKLQNWAEDKHLRFSEFKCRILNFTRKRKNVRDIQVYLNDKLIQNVDTVQHLGLIFDSRLSWKAHIQHLKQKCTQRLNILKKLGSTRWGSDRSTLLYFYISLVRSVINYGSNIYSNTSATTVEKLNPIQNIALRKCIGAYPTSPAIRQHVKAQILPLKHHLNLSMLKYYSKLYLDKTNSNFYKTFRSPHRQHNKKSFGAKCISLLEQYSLPPLQDNTPLKCTYSMLEATVTIKFQEEWSKCTTNKLHNLILNLLTWSPPLHTNRIIDTALTRLRIGHTNLTHNFLFLTIPPPTCNFCPSSILSVQHILNVCPEFASSRSRLFGNPSYKITSLLIKPDPRIINFLKECNILSKL